MIKLKIKQIKQGFEVIKKSEVLTKREKRELTTKAIIELINAIINAISNTSTKKNLKLASLNILSKNSIGSANLPSCKS